LLKIYICVTHAPPGLARKHWTGLKGLIWDKHHSSFLQIISVEEKINRFISVTLGVNVFKKLCVPDAACN
jgi:hypothetical protein